MHGTAHNQQGQQEGKDIDSSWKNNNVEAWMDMLKKMVF
jgi:hypothetical protein